MKEIYDLKSVKLPRMSGTLLKLFVWLIEGPLRGLLARNLLKASGITWLRDQHFEEPPTLHPIHFVGAFHERAERISESEWPTQALKRKGHHFPGVADFAEAYRQGKTTPEEVAVRVLQAVESSDAYQPPFRALIDVQREEVIKQAREATERIRAECALSLLDGVPVAIKDELDVAGYPTTVGTAFLGKSPAAADSEVVARLRKAGALIIGKSNMHEIGMGVTGVNPHHGAARNPYDPNCMTGGSSSGSGAAVAAGLVPVAIGADGGGSIRIPAAFCGIVGLKPTFGRVSEHGAVALDWSVAHIGPMAWSASDAALLYAAMAGPDPKDPLSMHQPLPSLEGWDRPDLRGLRLGIFRPWFRHADSEVVTACEGMLQQFQSAEGKVREVVLPDLEAGRIAHSISIATEMAQAMNQTARKHNHQHGLDVRVTLALARQFTAPDYVQAQRVRTRLIHHFNEAFRQVDVILTPTTAMAAPEILPAVVPDGELNLSQSIEIMRFVTPANLTGLPAISFPVGYTRTGLPIGMQAIGPAWSEASLLRMALAAEQFVERKTPKVCYRILE